VGNWGTDGTFPEKFASWRPPPNVARFPRVVIPRVAHHITQRGNARRPVFCDPTDRQTYLQLLAENCRSFHLHLLGYCLMSNHVHLIAVPERPDSMALALRHTHGRYAAFVNARRASSGHLWQGRYYSCPLDEAHLWTALRYVELNPVRAQLVTIADAYEWSSAATHYRGACDSLLDLETWKARWTPAEWREFLSDPADQQQDADLIRASTHTGRPLGSRDFVTELERRLGRHLAPRPGGHPPKQNPSSAQQSFHFCTPLPDAR
jgi:putative transposase